MTFDVAFAYLSSKRMNNFEWALSKVQKKFVKDDILPWVIIIDMDLSLMNALETMLPSSTNLLCLFHIIKNDIAK